MKCLSKLLLGCVLLTAAGLVAAAPTAPTAPAGPPATEHGAVIGRVLAVSGKVEITDATGRTHIAGYLEEIHVGDVISTSSNSRIQIGFIDHSLLSLDEKTRVEIRDFRFTQDGGNDAMVLKLSDGTIQYTTGLIAVHNPENVSTITPLARIGLDPAQPRQAASTGADALDPRPTFYAVTASYDATTTTFMTGAPIIVYSKVGAERMNEKGRMYTVTENSATLAAAGRRQGDTGAIDNPGPGGNPNLPDSGLPPSADNSNDRPGGGGWTPGGAGGGSDTNTGIDQTLPTIGSYMTGYAVAVHNGDTPTTMEILANSDCRDFHLDQVIVDGSRQTVQTGGMHLTLGSRVPDVPGPGAPPAITLDFTLGGTPPVRVTDPQLILKDTTLTVIGSADYRGWGTWQAVFVNPADAQDTKEYRGVWSATAFASVTPEQYLLSLNTIGRYQGVALAIHNDTQTLTGTSKYAFDFGQRTFTGSMAFPQFDMTSSGTLNGGGFNGHIDAINSNSAGISSSVNGGFYGPQAEVINGTFQATQGANTFNGVMNGQK